jgi:hypothetical protein
MSSAVSGYPSTLKAVDRRVEESVVAIAQPERGEVAEPTIAARSPHRGGTIATSRPSLSESIFV